MTNSDTQIFLEAIDQNFEDEDYDYNYCSDSSSVDDSIKEKKIEKLNESFCDSLDLDLDNSFCSHLSKEIAINSSYFQKRKLLLINDILLVNEQKINDLKQYLKQKIYNEYCSNIQALIK